jgi:hypothetical protein
MTRVLVGGDDRGCEQLWRWLEAWGLRARRLDPREHPATVSTERARAVVFAFGEQTSLPPAPAAAPAAAPLVVVGPGDAGELELLAWERVNDPGPAGERLAAALRPCLDTNAVMQRGGPAFRDFLNHELRTPLTAAGMALQTLALHLESAGGPSLDLLDTALRNIQRLEQTVEWATDYVVDEPSAHAQQALPPVQLTDLLADLDAIDSSLDLTWSTDVGVWEAETSIARDEWRRLLRQVHRALAFQQADAAVRLRVSLTGDQQGLLLVFEMPRRQNRGDLADTCEEQLRRLLTFTIHPDLARRLQLRYDVVLTGEGLRLRLLLPTMAGEPAAAMQPA